MLRSANATTRGDALSWLSGAVSNQGARFPVSAAVVPFLVALAEMLAYFPATERTVDALVASVAPASANLTLAYLPDSPAVDKHLASQLDDGPLDIRMAAAVALAFRLGPDLPAAALDLLVDEKPPPAPPGWDRSMRGFVTLALRRVGL